MESEMTKDEAIQAVIDELRGTSESLDTVADAHGIDPMDQDLCDQIDQSIFLCAECAWWCEMNEEVSEFFDLEEWTCRQCAIDNHGYDGEE